MFDKTLGPLNQEPDHRSGSSQAPNLGPDHGQVQLGSGSNQGSELNLSNPIMYTSLYTFSEFQPAFPCSGDSIPSWTFVVLQVPYPLTTVSKTVNPYIYILYLHYTYTSQY